MDIFRVRLNCIDHYQAVPSSFDPEVPWVAEDEEKQSRPKIPMLRVFGSTETGQKVCAHIHGAFPYLYIKYTGSIVLDDVNSYIYRLQLSIDHALAVSYRRNTYNGNTKFVAHISLVKGIPFYGYHVGWECFLKIYMLNPLYMTRLADLLRQGAIMRRAIQPYESHMQYISQWMCDYNLYGCAYIECRRVAFRAPIPDYLEMESAVHKWHDRAIHPFQILDEDLFPRQSYCSLEIDLDVADIRNRDDVKQRSMHQDFVETHEPIVSDQKLVQSMASLWRDETKRRKARMGITDPGSSPFPADVLVSVSADPRNSQAGGWIHEEDYQDTIRNIIAEERSKSDGRKLGFGEFVRKVPLESLVKTALEGVEDLFHDNLRRSRELAQKTQQRMKASNHNDLHVPQVDESRLSSYNDDNVFRDSEDDQSLEHIASPTNKSQPEDRSTETKSYANASKRAEEPKVGQPHDQAQDNGASCVKKPAYGVGETSKDATSTAELEAFGVYNAGSNSGPQEDFEVEEDFTSEIATERKRATASNPGLLPKKQKLAHHMSINSEPPNKALSTSSIATNAHTAMNDMLRSRSDEKISPAAFKSGRSSKSSQDRSSRLSRSQQTVNGLSPNGKLSFPIVKNIQDRPIVAKSSQSSSDKAMDVHILREPLVTNHSSDSTAPIDHVIVLPPDGSPRSPNLSSHVPQCCEQLRRTFSFEIQTRICCFSSSPLTTSKVQSDMKASKFATTVHQDVHYGCDKDVPERPREYAGREFRIEGNTAPYLPPFDPSGASVATTGARLLTTTDHGTDTVAQQCRQKRCSLRIWEFDDPPPNRGEVQRWLDQKDNGLQFAIKRNSVKGYPTGNADISQIDNTTQKNKHGFKYSQKQKTSVEHETQYMSTMSLEVHVNTRNNLVPNPELDEVSCVFWSLQSNDESLMADGDAQRTRTGVVVLSEEEGFAGQIAQQTAIGVESESSELDVITRTVDVVRRFDPDILTGFEVHGSSWGYMIERARCKYDYNLCDEFSRVGSDSHGRFGKEEDRWGFNHTSTIRVTGRHMINIWRAMRGELNLLQYTMENVVFQLCHRRIPHYSFSELSSWYKSGSPRGLAKVLNYYTNRVQLNLEILEQNELVPRTSEQARLLGVDFFSVFSRGSQFKVESLMFRIAKPENLVLPSPSRQQVGQQNALECLPLVMEPQSAFFNSPLIVLDFQSLYPSIMIAYNYCYSTCLGRVVRWRGQNKMGFTDYHRQSRLLELLGDKINIAPNGIMYTKPSIRKSLLAKMLSEILETRVMVKSGMKVDKDDRTLQRLLNNRQLALKLIANVTYGYTSASFSGRMPCSEIADSIVQTGRETLEKAIALIHSVDRWRAEVVYGDTDSLFVYLKGRTKDEAFDIGAEIAKAVTDMNPRPVKLKFEKVYHPCVLLAKKRYVGFKYESKDQKEPDFDAKGIETVRRDGTPAEQKMEEKALKVLFRTADLSQVKRYFQDQCEKIMRGKVSIQDFCFAKEVKLGTYSEKGPPPPGALISTRKMLEDPRAEPQYGERVPYVVITGAPGARLIDRCVAPETVLHDDNNELDAEYYISKNLIPPLERIFNLVGANVRQWYDEMPKYQRIRRVDAGALAKGNEQRTLKKTLESYLKSSSCLVCGRRLEQEIGLCSACSTDEERSQFIVQSRLCKVERKANNLEQICRSCSSLAWGEDIKCDSRDCPVFYSRTKQVSRLRNTRALVMSVAEGLRDLSLDGMDW